MSKFNVDCIDLNCDVGEVSFERDRQLLSFVSSCNVSCGAHAGDFDLIESTIREAIELGVAIGAHPSYPDRENFGRRTMDLSPLEFVVELNNQIALIEEMVKSLGGKLHHVKPHGALYHEMLTNKPQAEAVVKLLHDFDSSLALYGQADTQLSDICKTRGVRFVHEAFADRRYENQTTLRSRTHRDAVISGEGDFLEQLSTLHSGHVVDVHNQRHTLTVETICLHSDTPHALKFAKAANRYFKEHHVRIAAP